MLYTGNFVLRYYVRFSQIRSQIGCGKPLFFSVFFEALHLALPGLRTGWLAGCPSGELQVNK